MGNYSLVNSTKEEVGYIRNGLIRYNSQRVPAAISANYEEISLALKDGEGKVIGGFIGEYCWDWIEVHILWVDESHRGEGCGSKLLQAAESIAVEKNCSWIKLNTFSFQAPGFYEKHGFQVVGIIDHSPHGFKHYYLAKKIG